jgi:hypothetical protein
MDNHNTTYFMVLVPKGYPLPAFPSTVWLSAFIVKLAVVPEVIWELPQTWCGKKTKSLYAISF